jgi:NADH:ubiquinone oxidoreductase subunit F (NADH-binding)
MSTPALPRLLAPGGHTRADVAYRRERLVEAVAEAGLRGRGGAAFPTAVKMRAVAAARGRRALVVNGAEGEPMSAKDRVLMEVAPHLALDGAALAAEAVGACDVMIAVKRSASLAHESLRRALAERRDASRMDVRSVPDGYVAGEETALLSGLNGGAAKPALALRRPYERGLARRPTLVCNVETFAHVALIARRGAPWFRELGPAEHAGSALVTLGGAIARPGVYEIALGMPIVQVIDSAGGRSAPVRALLVGGYYGAWLPPEAIASLRLDNGSLREWDAALGVGAVVALPADACPVAEVARVVRWMAGESAGQCGPCVYGLDALASALASLAAGTAGRGVSARLGRWCAQVAGRGACRHPDGVVRFVRSALDVFAEEFEDHRRHGPCDACDRRPVLAVPGTRRSLAA